MLKIIFYQKADKVKANGECPIFAKISCDGESFTLATGKYLDSQRWKLTNNLRNVLKIEKEKVIRHSFRHQHSIGLSSIADIISASKPSYTHNRIWCGKVSSDEL